MNLTKKDIRLGQEISNKEEAIRKAGEILVENGYVDSDYIPAMLEREEIVSTYMGNFIAIPHGTDEAKKSIKSTGISIIQIPGVLNGFSHIKFEPLAKQVVFLGYYLADRQHYFYIFSLFHIILMWFIYKYISENSKNISESLFLLLTSVFFTFSLSGIRQAISTMIAFYALKYLEKNKVFHFIFFIIMKLVFLFLSHPPPQPYQHQIL